MTIDEDFPKNHQVMGKHKHSDGEHYHFVWGPGRSDAETSTRPEVQEAYTRLAFSLNYSSVVAR